MEVGVALGGGSLLSRESRRIVASRAERGRKYQIVNMEHKQMEQKQKAHSAIETLIRNLLEFKYIIMIFHLDCSENERAAMPSKEEMQGRRSRK